MSRALVIIRESADREKVSRWANSAPVGTRVEWKAPKRTLSQNDRLHAMLTELAEQVEWYGQRRSVSDWKLIFMDALSRELRIVPNLDGDGFVNLGRSTSKLSKEEMSDLMELIQMFGAQHGVTFKDPKEQAA